MRQHNPITHDIENPSSDRNITGKELKSQEEFRTQLSVLVELLDEKGLINKKEYQRIVSMRLHELSKALAFEDMDEEI
ncbi:MAG TPA: hypothetical protein VEL11_07320 [Candidatus Bathyarchaeia archaeon]|nr:hypothetical protein [Candidatus Bathyarchaeia archaeon]